MGGAYDVDGLRSVGQEAFREVRGCVVVRRGQGAPTRGWLRGRTQLIRTHHGLRRPACCSSLLRAH
jgi:hypothetical protein